ncbi:MAG: carboxypeptidase-like regulatory domain-containing protein [Phycisphaerales bacterium]
MVFRDTDADGIQDPVEHALKRVTVFADVDGDGRLGAGEASVVTDGYGRFRLTGLPAGTYDVRVVMPDGYKGTGAEYSTVTISPSQSAGALELGLAPTGFDLVVQLSDVSMPEMFKTGTVVKVPVLVTNLGDAFMPGGDISLRLHLSGNQSLSDDDIRLTKTALGHGLKPGESVKIELEVTLADALADFSSYLILDAVGRSLRSDLDRENNEDTSDSSLWFETSNRQPTLGDGIVGIVKQNWVVVAPYGGYAPGYGYGDGFVGISDLNVELGNWNAGTPPRPPSNINMEPVIRSVTIAGGSLVHGQTTRITAEGVYDPDGTVQRVWFFYDSDNDRVIDDVLGVDTDGTDGYSVLASMSADRRLSSGGQVLAVAMDNGYELGGAMVNALPSLSVTVGAGNKLVYRESDGSTVEVSLAGSGGAQVLLRGSGIRAWDLGETIEITGDAEVEEIALNRTTGRSKLRIKTNRADKHELGTAVTGKITGSTPLGLLSAKGVDLTGGIHMTGRGVIRTIEAKSINGIDMPGVAYKQGVTILTDKVYDDITLGSPLKMLDVNQLNEVDITAPWADSILVGRSYWFGKINFTDADAGFGLRQMRVGGRMTAVDIRSEARVGTVKANSMNDCSIQVGGLWSITLLTGNRPPARETLGRLIVTGDFTDTYVGAWRIGQVSIQRTSTDPDEIFQGLVYHRIGRYDGPDQVPHLVV